MEDTSKLPLVSVICLSFNKSSYILKTLDSVLAQTYPLIELIIVDDSSTDTTPEILKNFKTIQSSTELILLNHNVGMCTAFNLGLQISKGKYIIDLAGDDILEPNRVEKQVAILEEKGEKYGVAFSDAWIINSESQKVRTFYKRDKEGKLRKPVPQGDIYEYLVGKQLISSPTMMMRRSMLEELGGYDEAMSYEDYDFWVRSSRKYKYVFQDEQLTLKRVAPKSISSHWYDRKNNKLLKSTLKVIKKAYLLNLTSKENDSLAISIRYHLRQSVVMECFFLAKGYAKLLSKISRFNLVDKLFIGFIKVRLPLYQPYITYLKIRKLLLR